MKMTTHFLIVFFTIFAISSSAFAQLNQKSYGAVILDKSDSKRAYFATCVEVKKEECKTYDIYINHKDVDVVVNPDGTVDTTTLNPFYKGRIDASYLKAMRKEAKNTYRSITRSKVILPFKQTFKYFLFSLVAPPYILVVPFALAYDVLALPFQGVQALAQSSKNGSHTSKISRALKAMLNAKENSKAVYLNSDEIVAFHAAIEPISAPRD